MRGILLTIAIAGCAAAGGCATGDEAPVAESSDETAYIWQDDANAQDSVRDECRSRVRRTGSRIPRCPKESGIYSKAYHNPERVPDDRGPR
ncbi:MAG: hypothetical protein AAF417_00610 [Pseudomonadota bacterium]